MTVAELPHSPGVGFRLFGAPPLRVLAARLHLPHPRWRRMNALWLVLFAWFPLLLLSTLEQRVFAGQRPFYTDFAVHARLFVMLPVLLLGKEVADRMFGRAMDFLVASGAVSAVMRLEFDRRLQRFARWRDAWPMLLLLVILAYALTWLEYNVPANRLYSWRTRPDLELTPAGYWYFFFARPLVLTHLLSWLWTFALWVWLLGSLLRMPLRLLAFHPDRHGGLEPVLVAHRVFVLLSFAIGADLGGSLANRMVHAHEPFAMYRMTLIVIVAVLTVVLLAPLFLLTRPLLPAYLDALEEYGAMGSELSRLMQRESIAALHRGVDEPMKSLITAHKDSGNALERIAGTHIVPFTRHYVLSFLLAPIIPIALATLTRIPLSTVIERLRSLFLH